MESQLFVLFKSAVEVFLPVLYVVTVLAYGAAFFREDKWADAGKSRLLLITGVLHFFYIGLHTAEHGHCMVTTPFEMMSLVAFTILGTYTIIEFKTRISGTGFFLVGLAALFELTSAVTIGLPQAVMSPNPVLSNMGIGFHVSAAIFGFGGIAISAMYGVLYLLLYRELKRGSFGSVFRHLPSLESLERLSVAGMAVGFVFLTVATFIGIFWLPKIFADFSWTDPKLLSTAIIWILYAVVLISRFGFRVDGRRVITMSIGGFILSVLSLTIVNAFFSRFHRFF